MNWISFIQVVKNLLFNYKVSEPEPRLGDTPIENIEFPVNYKPTSLYAAIPDRQDGSMSGSQFGQSILNIPATQQRDDIIIAQCMAGNLPNWMRTFKEIVISERGNTLTYFVSPDVLCIGNNSDFLRVSLNGYSARHVVDIFGCILPTKKIANQIFLTADLRLNPTGMGASNIMTTTGVLITHNNIIEQQRAGRNFNIITGHKKDIVLAKNLLGDRSRLAIFGWFYPNGQIIQQLNSTSHSIDYQDYSSSVRLVAQNALLNGQTVNLYDILNDDRFSYLISDEGSFDARSMYK